MPKKAPEGAVFHKKVLWDDEWISPLNTKGDRPVWCKLCDDGDWLVQWKTTQSYFAPEEIMDCKAYIKKEAADAIERAEREVRKAEAVEEAIEAKKLAAYELLEAEAVKRAPVMYTAADVKRQAGRTTMQGVEQAFLKAFEDEEAKLRAVVVLTKEGVVHGIGVVAKRDLRKGHTIIDPTACFKDGAPPQKQTEKERSEAYMHNGDGYFLLHWWLYETIFKATYTYFVNEAKGDAQPNIEIVVHYDGRRPILQWRTTRTIRQGEELLYVYNAGDRGQTDAFTSHMRHTKTREEYEKVVQDSLVPKSQREYDLAYGGKRRQPTEEDGRRRSRRTAYNRGDFL